MRNLDGGYPNQAANRADDECVGAEQHRNDQTVSHGETEKRNATAMTVSRTPPIDIGTVPMTAPDPCACPMTGGTDFPVRQSSGAVRFAAGRIRANGF
jgi:hypothetical protein